MEINWFTIIAQFINFFILVWLLKRFLYKPILNAIDVRKKNIAVQIENAEKTENKAKAEKEEYQKKIKEFDTQRNLLMNKAIEEANAEKSRLMEITRNEAKELNSKLENSIKEKEKHIITEISLKTKSEVFEIVRKTLKDLSNIDLETQMINIFVNKINNTTEAEMKNLKIETKDIKAKVSIRSVFDLTFIQKETIENAFNNLLKSTFKYEYETKSALINGIEVKIEGFKISWNISDYLSSIEQSIEKIINLQTNK